MTVDDILQHLKQMGCKLTPQRRMIVEALQEAGEKQTSDGLLETGEEQMSADEIYQRVRATYPEVGLDTIYRNLRLLVKLNVVDEVKLPGKLAQYSLNRRAHMHELVCLDCGLEIPLGHCPIKELETVAREEHGFRISSHRIELFGYCPKCAGAHHLS